MARVEPQGFLSQYLLLHGIFPLLGEHNAKLDKLRKQVLQTTIDNAIDFAVNYCVKKIILRVMDVLTFDAERHGNIGRKLVDKRVFQQSNNNVEGGTVMLHLLMETTLLYKFKNWTVCIKRD